LRSIVVTEHAVHRRIEMAEHLERLGLRDVAGVDDAIDARRVEQLDDPRDVAQVVVGVTDDADAHGERAEERSPDRDFFRSIAIRGSRLHPLKKSRSEDRSHRG
jgi:hypothetical protein